MTTKKIALATVFLSVSLLFSSCGSTAPCGLAKAKQDTIQKQKSNTTKEILVASAEQ